MIGEGSLRTALERHIQRLGLRQVTLTGRLANHEVIRLLQGCDVLLNPTDVDNMPISVIEAMAIGVPIVSTNVGGVRYLLEDGRTALLVGMNDHQAMARAVLRILKSPAVRERLRENARRVTDDFRWEKVWPLWRSLYLSFSRRSSQTAIRANLPTR